MGNCECSGAGNARNYASDRLKSLQDASTGKKNKNIYESPDDLNTSWLEDSP